MLFADQLRPGDKIRYKGRIEWIEFNNDLYEIDFEDGSTSAFPAKAVFHSVERADRGGNLVSPTWLSQSGAAPAITERQLQEGYTQMRENELGRASKQNLAWP